jgi:hypothetical protein
VREHQGVFDTTRAICELGHAVDNNVVDPGRGLADSTGMLDGEFSLTAYKVDRFCQQCGSPVLFTCPTCDAPISTVPRVTGASTRGMPFCGRCGSPMPWASRTARALRMKGLRGQTGVDDVHRLAAIEAIDELAAADPDDEEAQAEAGGKLKRALGRGFDIVVPVAQSLMTAAVKQALGLP